MKVPRALLGGVPFTFIYFFVKWNTWHTFSGACEMVPAH